MIKYVFLNIKLTQTSQLVYFILNKTTTTVYFINFFPLCYKVAQHDYSLSKYDNVTEFSLSIVWVCQRQ